MLQPDPTNPTQYRFAGHEVKVESNRTFQNLPANSAPIAIGDFQQFGTLFRRKPLQIDSTSIGGNAWRTNSTEMRGITRLDAKTYDADAVVLGAMAL